MKRALLSIVLLAVGAFTQGCATIVTKGVTKLSFDSSPSGATVTIDGREVGRTPLAVNVSKKATGTVRFSKEGYKPAITQLDKGFNVFFLGNFICGGFFGSTTDAATGAVFEYDPKHYFVTLPPEDAPRISESTSLSGRQKAKEFIVVGYKNIRTDLNAGQGEYLTSLLDVLGVPPEGAEEAVRRLRALAEAYPAIPEFADHATNAFMPPE